MSGADPSSPDKMSLLGPDNMSKKHLTICLPDKTSADQKVNLREEREIRQNILNFQERKRNFDYISTISRREREY